MATKTRIQQHPKPSKAKTIPAKRISDNTKKSGQDKWDELLATPESEALLTLLVAQAKREEEAGNFDEEDW